MLGRTLPRGYLDLRLSPCLLACAAGWQSAALIMFEGSAASGLGQVCLSAVVPQVQQGMRTRLLAVTGKAAIGLVEPAVAEVFAFAAQVLTAAAAAAAAAALTARNSRAFVNLGHYGRNAVHSAVDRCRMQSQTCLEAQAG